MKFDRYHIQVICTSKKRKKSLKSKRRTRPRRVTKKCLTRFSICPNFISKKPSWQIVVTFGCVAKSLQPNTDVSFSQPTKCSIRCLIRIHLSFRVVGPRLEGRRSDQLWFRPRRGVQSYSRRLEREDEFVMYNAVAERARFGRDVRSQKPPGKSIIFVFFFNQSSRDNLRKRKKIDQVKTCSWFFLFSSHFCIMNFNSYWYFFKHFVFCLDEKRIF